MYSFKACLDAATAHYNYDSNTAHLVRHLLVSTFQEILRFEYPEMGWASGMLLPMFTGVDSGAREWGYFQTGPTGEAAIVADDATDVPMVGTEGDYKVGKVVNVACGFHYSEQEIDSFRMMGLGSSLPEEKARNAREMHDRKINDLIAFGEPDKGLYGITNYPGINVLEAPTGSWLTATAEQITADFNNAWNYQFTTTGAIDAPDAAVFSLEAWGRISTLKLTEFTNTTVLQYLKSTHPQIKLWAHDNTMDRAGEGSTSSFMLYKRDMTRARVVIPRRLSPLPPERRGMRTQVIMRSRYGGPAVPRPKSIARIDGI